MFPASLMWIYAAFFVALLVKNTAVDMDQISTWIRQPALKEIVMGIFFNPKLMLFINQEQARPVWRANQWPVSMSVILHTLDLTAKAQDSLLADN